MRVEEVWVDVRGYECWYSVSSMGRVRNKTTGQVLAPFRTGRKKNGSQYLSVEFGRQQFKVHRLVAEAFIPNPEGLSQVNHVDGDKENNSVENLEWCSPRDNVSHSYKHGLSASGEKKCGHKLSERDVIEIRRTYIHGDAVFGAKPLARRFGVSDTTIRRIVKNRKWRYCHED